MRVCPIDFFELLSAAFVNVPDIQTVQVAPKGRQHMQKQKRKEQEPSERCNSLIHSQNRHVVGGEGTAVCSPQDGN